MIGTAKGTRRCILIILILVKESIKQPVLTKLPSSVQFFGYLINNMIVKIRIQVFLLALLTSTRFQQTYQQISQMGLFGLNSSQITSDIQSSTIKNPSSKLIHQCNQLYRNIMSQQSNKKCSQKALQKSIRNIVTQASREKLLPKIMWNAAREFGSKRLINYQKSVRHQYENQLKNPLKYDPQSAKSQRQKFRDKVLQLMNNELDVEYVENVRLKDRTLITYQGRELQQEKVQTKKQFQMFKHFNQKRFKETYTNIFQDKLEIGYEGIYHNKAKKRCHTLNILEVKQINQLEQQIRLNQSVAATKFKASPVQIFHFSKTPRKNITVQSAKKKQMIYFNQKKTVGNQNIFDQQTEVARIMRQIGGFDQRISPQQLSLTKQSISKWLKFNYQKSTRLYDFFQFKEVMNFHQFLGISKRIRVMPLEHFLFMAFLYYDGNNDGYICDYDLERLSNLALRRPILKHDFQKIKKSNIKKLLTKKQAYLQLYKLSQITESKFFQWKRKNQQSQNGGFQLQMKNRVLSSKQKHIFLDFPAFCSIYKYEKPFIWYDLLYLFSGATYQGLSYQ